MDRGTIYSRKGMHPYFPTSKLALPTISQTLCSSTSSKACCRNRKANGAGWGTGNSTLRPACCCSKPIAKDLSRTCLLGQHMVC